MAVKDVKDINYTQHEARIDGIDVDTKLTMKILAGKCNYSKMKMINEMLTEAISSAKHFAMVIDVGGHVQGVLIGLTGDNLWAQRQNCNIVIWVSRVSGYGGILLRKFKEWVQPRRAIKVSGMCPDLEVDPRALKLAEHLGFERHGGAYLLYN